MTWMQYVWATVHDAAGKKVYVQPVDTLGSPSFQRVRLAPGETAGLASSGLAFLRPSGSETSNVYASSRVLDAEPGVYGVEYTFQLPDGRSEQGLGAQRPGDWSGTLTTGVREITIADEVAGEYPSETLNKIFSASNKRTSELRKLGLKIEFTQRIKNFAGQPHRVEEFTGTLWMSRGREVVEVHDRRGYSATYYHNLARVAAKGTRWEPASTPLTSIFQLLPPSKDNPVALGELLVYPDARLMHDPAELIARQWRQDLTDLLRWTDVDANNITFSEDCDGSPGCVRKDIVNGTEIIDLGEMAVAPSLGYAPVECGDAVASDFTQIDDTLWFPRKVVRSSPGAPGASGAPANYQEELEVTEITLDPAVSDSFFNLPNPGPDTYIVVNVPEWRPEWTDSRHVAASAVKNFDSIAVLEFEPGRAPEAEALRDEFKIWRLSIDAAVDWSDPIPFYDTNAKRAVYARYNVDKERLVPLAEGESHETQPPHNLFPAMEVQQSSERAAEIIETGAESNAGVQSTESAGHVSDASANSGTAAPDTVIAAPPAGPPGAASVDAGDPDRAYLRTPPADVVWGEVNNGLQAAVYFQPEQPAYELREKIGLEFLVRNAGTTPVEFVSREPLTCG